MLIPHPTITTEKRRTLQVLWNALDRHVAPFAKQGIALAVSGGVDSRALLEAYATWPQRFLGKVIVLSVDHQSRPEARLEALHVVGRAKTLGFEAYPLRLSGVHPSEASWRKARYKAIFSAMETHCVYNLCIAHHIDDEAEGFFLDLLGLGGAREGESMGVVRKFENQRLLRPFLSLSKTDLLLALSALGVVDSLEDPSNAKGIGERAALRSDVFPLLKAHFPSLPKRIAKRAQQLSALHEVLDESVQKKLFCQQDSVIIHDAALLPDAVLRRALQLALSHLKPEEDLREHHKKIEEISVLVRSTLDQEGKWVTLRGREHFVLPQIRAIFDGSFILLKRTRL